jgi:hypothetical protein
MVIEPERAMDAMETGNTMLSIAQHNVCERRLFNDVLILGVVAERLV